ncbi:class I SAM-dependent methyltransferase, partial [Candidatus Aerophobetes bacterium]|nr:class I SAM-dependent methyltransferase [Candidatus Aerophobetes bacterium]
YLKCEKCQRKFPIFAENLIEILPKKFPEWNLTGNENKKSEEDYKKLSTERFNWQKVSKGWGFLPEQKPGYRAFIKKERNKIKNLIPSSLRGGLMIDVSAGCGNYSIYLSSLASLMIHCEVEVQSLLSARKLAVNSRRENIIFTRASYLKLPFQDNLFEVVICTDTLERGKGHEIQLLKEIWRILKKGGRAIFDFHNLRILAKRRNPYITFYQKKDVQELLGELKINNFKIYPFGHFPTTLAPTESIYFILDKILFFLPPIRYIVVVEK